MTKDIKRVLLTKEQYMLFHRKMYEADNISEEKIVRYLAKYEKDWEHTFSKTDNSSFRLFYRIDDDGNEYTIIDQIGWSKSDVALAESIGGIVIYEKMTWSSL